MCWARTFLFRDFVRRVKPTKNKIKASSGFRWKKTESPNEDKYHRRRWTTASKTFLTTGGTIPVKRRRKKRDGSYHVYYEFYRPCAKCGKAGTTTDHKRNPAIYDDVDFWDQSNWQPLCPSCHSSKTLTEINKKRGLSRRRGT